MTVRRDTRDLGGVLLLLALVALVAGEGTLALVLFVLALVVDR